jgi:hypothetical protein
MKLTTFDSEPCDRYHGTCTDQGTYADDCLVNRVTVNKCYVVATVSPLRFLVRSGLEESTRSKAFAHHRFRMIVCYSAIEI